MKFLLTPLLLGGAVLTLAVAHAQSSPVVVSHNVSVVNNAVPSQCTETWRRRVAPEEITTTVSQYGNYSVGGPGVRSCTGCGYDKRTQSCLCATCYDYFNEP